jgi:hypothetical protein
MELNMYAVIYYDNLNSHDLTGKECVDDAGEIIRFRSLADAEKYARRLNSELQPRHGIYAAGVIETGLDVIENTLGRLLS